MAFTALDHVTIATDSEEVAGVCYAFGADVEMTSDRHNSGTERVAEVATRAVYADVSIIVNVQGDEPFIVEEHVSAAVQMVNTGNDIGTVAAPIRSLAVWRDPAVVKIARATNGRALYFSRAPIPFNRDADPDFNHTEGTDYLRHIGVYAYNRAALLKWVSLPESALEGIEKLEQLRPLEAGMSIGVAIVNAAEGGVDTAADLERANRLLSQST